MVQSNYIFVQQTNNRDNSLKYYTFTPFKTIALKGNAPEDIDFNEYQLNFGERCLQAMVGSVHGGLNGTSEWNNCNDCRRMKNISDRIPRLFAVIYQNQN